MKKCRVCGEPRVYETSSYCREHRNEWLRNKRKATKITSPVKMRKGCPKPNCGEVRPPGSSYCREHSAERTRDANRKRIGWSNESVDRVLEEQGGCCAICKSSTHNGRNWNADHDHNTNEPRGVLCAKCNMFVGFLETQGSTGLSNALEYLSKYGTYLIDI